MQHSKLNVEIYVQKVDEIREDILDCKWDLSDDDVAVCHLDGLPNSCSRIKMQYSLIMAGRGTPDGHDLPLFMNRLNEEESGREVVAKAKKALGQRQQGKQRAH